MIHPSGKISKEICNIRYPIFVFFFRTASMANPLKRGMK